MDPTVLGDYRLVGRLGEGGMGSVFLAHDRDDRLVAVKVIRSDLVDQPEFRRRFRSEVARAREVPPFCTAEVLDADPDHETPYLVVEYVDGPSLQAVVRDRGPLSPANLHGLAIGVATALTGIHSVGVIHRDLKPSNVLLAPGSPKVIDFGIARAINSSTGQTTTHHIIGSIAYMAPELLEPSDRHPITSAVDIFAWGSVVAFAGTGRSPFAAQMLPAVALRVLKEPPDLDGLTGPLRDLVERALAKDPAQRPAARDLLDELLTTGPRPAVPASESLPSQAQRLAEAGSRYAIVDTPNTPASLNTDLLAVTATKRPLSRRRRRTVGTMALITVLMAGGGAAMASGPEWPWTEPKTELASPTNAPPPTFPGQAPNHSDLIPAGGQLIFNEPLTTPGRVPVRTDRPDLGTCTFDGQLVAVAARTSYRCESPRDKLTDFAAFVDVVLPDSKSCAGVWFRYDPDAGYAMQVCADRIRIVIHGHPESFSVVPQREFFLDRPIEIEQPARIGIVATGNTFVFYRDGVEIGRWSNSQFDDGQVKLGVFPLTGADLAPYQVMFRNFELWDTSVL